MEQELTLLSQARRKRRFIVLLSVAVPVLYLLSFGPVVARTEHAGNATMRTLVGVIYRPVVWLHDYTFLEGPLDWYYLRCGGGKI